MPLEVVKEFEKKCQLGDRGKEGSLGWKVWERMKDKNCNAWAEAMTKILEHSGIKFQEDYLVCKNGHTVDKSRGLDLCPICGEPLVTPEEIEAVGVKQISEEEFSDIVSIVEDNLLFDKAIKYQEEHGIDFTEAVKRVAPSGNESLLFG